MSIVNNNVSLGKVAAVKTNDNVQGDVVVSHTGKTNQVTDGVKAQLITVGMNPAEIAKLKEDAAKKPADVTLDAVLKANGQSLEGIDAKILAKPFADAIEMQEVKDA